MATPGRLCCVLLSGPKFCEKCVCVALRVRMWTRPSPGRKRDNSCLDDVGVDRGHPSPPWAYPSPGPRAGLTTASSSSSSNPIVPGPHWAQPSPGQSSDHVHASADRQVQSRRIYLSSTSLSLIEGKAEHPTLYSQSGKDAKRIERVLSEGCNCGCLSTINASEAIRFCTMLYNLTEEDRAFFFRASYESPAAPNDDDAILSEPVPSRKKLCTQWYFEGSQVCVYGLCLLLGMSRPTFYKKCHGVLDKRVHGFQLASRQVRETQSLVVDHFFSELYFSAGERLPEIAESIEDVDAAIEANEPLSKQNDDMLLIDWTPNQSPMEAMRGMTPTNVEELPVRHLPHGKVMDLWWQFVAWHSACAQASQSTTMKLPSWSTFWRRWDSKWRFLLKFRKASQHSQCNICFNYSQFLHASSGTSDEKRRAATEWRDHLAGQYEDRLVYWHLRWFSRLRTKNVLVVIIDSMDKGKVSWPQYNHRAPKSLDKFVRPRLVITCGIAHGFCVDFSIAHDETMSHGASAFCEILTRLIERVMEICREQHIRPPEHLVVQSDNTTAQAKNSLVGQYLATLVSRSKFVTAVLNFLIVGHTHEDVDQVFSVLLSEVLHRYRFHTPDELVEYIQARMSVHFRKRGEQCRTYMLGHIFDFAEWLDAQGVSLHNAFVSRAGIDAPHSFCYKQRQDLTPAEQVSIGSRALRDAAPTDVFCTTKRFMHSAVSNGPPVLVLPRSRCDRALTPGPMGVSKKSSPMDNERRSHLRSFADALEALSLEWGPSFSYYRAAAALRDLAEWEFHSPAEHTWLWSRHYLREQPAPMTANRYFNNLPEMAWHLLVRFSRM